MVKESLVAEKKASEITRLTAEAVKTLHGFKLMGIDLASQDKISDILDNIFMQSRYGQDGVVVGVNNLKRAVAYFTRMGLTVDGQDMTLRLKNNMCVRLVGK